MLQHCNKDSKTQCNSIKYPIGSASASVLVLTTVFQRSQLFLTDDYRLQRSAVECQTGNICSFRVLRVVTHNGPVEYSHNHSYRWELRGSQNRLRVVPMPPQAIAEEPFLLFQKPRQFQASSLAASSRIRLSSSSSLIPEKSPGRPNSLRSMNILNSLPSTSSARLATFPCRFRFRSSHLR